MIRYSRLLPLCIVGLALTGCGIGSWFDGESEPPLPGDRIAVLRSDVAVAPDPAVAQLDVVLPPAALNPDWPQAGGTPDHAPVHAQLAPSPTRIWQVSVGEGTGRGAHILSAPVVANGRVFAMDAETNVSAVSAADGERLWSRSMRPENGEGGFGGGVAAVGDRVYVTTGYGGVAALDAATGDPIWSRTLPTPIRAAPTVAEGRVYAVTVDSRTEALDAATGQPVWTHTGIAETASVLGGASPAVSRGAVVVPYNSGEVFGLREDNGRMVWTDSLAALRRADVVSELAAIRGHPVAYRGLVFATSHSGRSVAIDLRSGMRIWDRDFGGVEMPWAAGDFVFMLTNRNELLALVAAEGRVRWVNPLPRFEDPKDRSDPIVWAGPVLAGGNLILVNSLGRAVFFSPATGEQVNDLALPSGATVPPVVAGGTMFVLSGDGTLSAYR
ncbi:outer membrane protein assembly factor BamB [Constrictibacter sp. MBR-5]|jgi:outer membrane protein assembly factor BamB|uniref:outer membrane protein assembly factor BamB family protein n=1 Tax=Constrictibacter sp. MBR-5 TaxID=3156467 RepID=UPI00339A4E9F